ncbi:MAG: protein translocase subunit SecF [Nocardioides sp.]
MGTFSRLGNDLYSGRRSIDFVGKWKLWLVMSGAIVALAIGGLTSRGLDMGIEFVGGAEYSVALEPDQVTQETADKIREAVAGTGIKNASAPVVTTNGAEAILIQIQTLTTQESEQVVAAIQDATEPDASVSQTELGASWGKEVAKRSMIGLVVFLVLVVLFIWAYFKEWKMSLAAIVALVHDLLITIGIYALSGFEVTPATVTGVLTILGFSLYDTVVVFDKVRENTKDLRRSRMTYAEAANLAVNQTLVRSINTSLVALIPVAAILYVGVAQLGSGSLKDLALALFVGMASGAYSSIFVATPMLAQLKMREKKVVEADRRSVARKRHDADRYASVPAFVDDTPVAGRSRAADADLDQGDGDPQAELGQDADELAQSGRRPRDRATAEAKAGVLGRGRVVPEADAPLMPSKASGRAQPTRQARSKRGKK